MENPPSQGEHIVEKELEIQGEPIANPHDDQFKEGVLTSPFESDEEGTNVDHVEPVARASEKDKGRIFTFKPLLLPLRPAIQDPVRAEDQAVAPEHPSSSPLPTPAPPSPPSSSTAPTTFKQPLPRNISSPTPFPSESSSSPASSTSIPPPIVEVPLASSSAGASSSGPSSSGPSIPPPSTSHSFLHPPTPPSFVTIIPEGDQLEHHMIQDIKDEFEVGQTFLAKVVSTHLLLVSTQCFKANAECCRNGEVVSTLDQVDTLRKLCDLKSLLDMWHSRDLGDRPWIMCPRPPRVLLDTLDYKYSPNWPSNKREPPRAFRKSFWLQREFSSLFLLPLCFFTPIHTSSSTRREA
ncbi:hypothetical protein Taro_038267 [Colocasia esculenta]|uniref:Uncharacterized protein n=1 Tax=Colocasia esculenta TaxID=4460 RepID=A0A843WDF2_COLES|nr:hypothetical protein [Colocasia esculenta]